MTDKKEGFDMLQLVLFRHILEDPIIKQLAACTRQNEKPSIIMDANLLANCIEQAEKLGLAGSFIPKYIVYRLSLDENLLSLTNEQKHTPGKSLRLMALRDLEVLTNFIHLPWSEFIPWEPLHDYEPTEPQENQAFEQLFQQFMEHPSPEVLYDRLTNHYTQNGSGQFAAYRAFRYDPTHGLIGIDLPEKIHFNDLLGYERQKQTLRRNTEAFVQGLGGNNVLLTGSKGTGKSSCVKALLTEYGHQGLRLIEMAKQDIAALPDLLKLLRPRGCKFIIFLDDLSFEDFEGDYKYLKSLLEGGLESRPANVLIYATSNRRHLIKETWADRNASTEEVHGTDGLQEKLSLADRFGLTITFLPPDQEEYLAIVDYLADKAGIRLPLDELHRQALQWELAQNGRSGRAANQFIQNLLTFLTEGGKA